jgi:CRISPR-associated endonuclease/helicase Cas3
MIAHIRQSDHHKQSLKDHAYETAKLCENSAKSIECPTVGRLIGLLHDFGKGNEQFKNYIIWSADNPGKTLPKNIPHPKHAADGARYAYHRWYKSESEKYHKLTAQIISMVICGHHAGLHDCVNYKGESDFLNIVNKDLDSIEKENYNQSLEYFLKEITDEKTLDELFELSCTEIKNKIEEFMKITNAKLSRFDIGMLTRFFLSCLVDADRWNSACFEYNGDSFENNEIPDWNELSERLDKYIKENFKEESDIAKTRSAISDNCENAAMLDKGIFTLSVPTGGGKTLASLRFALKHAGKYNLERIFYIIPFNTILDQNACDIEQALDNYPNILEHHSNIIKETDQEEQEYKHLTERWDTDIILTSLVQFLNTLYRKENTNTRRMNRLVKSVIVFDEIQSLPVKCRSLFEKAINFLTLYCGSTVLLCTATQPSLKFLVKEKEIIPDVNKLYTKLKRVSYNSQVIPEYTYEEAAGKITEFLENNRSTLMIVNTKAAALEIYTSAKQILTDNGYTAVRINENFNDVEIQKAADESKEDEILFIHLTTMMCAAHRKELLRWMKIWNRKNKKVLCVSTALIEAGINVSFPVVIRSLAGLPSIVQAAGRCNRNMEFKIGQVYIWKLDAEKLDTLKEIREGQDVSYNLISNNYEVDLPETMEQYFKQLDNKQKDRYEFEFKHGNEKYKLVDLLSNNQELRENAENSGINKNIKKELIFYQSFREAGEKFNVIDQRTVSVLTSYRDGKDIIAELGKKYLSMKEKRKLLKKAQLYSVDLYKNIFDTLKANNAIELSADADIIFLKDGYYDFDVGIKTEKGELEAMIF